LKTTHTREVLCSWVERINITKMFRQPKVIFSFNATPIRTPITFSINRKNNSNVCMETQKIANRQLFSLRKKAKAKGITIPDLKLYYKVTVTQKVCCWHKIDTWTSEAEL
jgi:hypothetical protein